MMTKNRTMQVCVCDRENDEESHVVFGEIEPVYSSERTDVIHGVEVKFRTMITFAMGGVM